MENTNELMTANSAELLEKVLVNGDLSTLSASQRLDYYRQVCQSCGLNPLTKPFDYIRLNGKLTLYARKDATDQLRKLHGVSIDDCTREYLDDLIIVTVKGHDDTGRTDVEIGVVSRKDMQGNFANALMKANTKAKRRLSLSICGLGWLDETEVETIPDAAPVIVDDEGEIIQSTPRITVEAPKQPAPKPEFDEENFLRNWSKPAGVPGMSKLNAEKMPDSKGQPYGEKTTKDLFYMLRAITKKIETLTDEQKPDYQLKVSAICEILQNRKLALTLPEERTDPFVPSN